SIQKQLMESLLRIRILHVVNLKPPRRNARRRSVWGVPFLERRSPKSRGKNFSSMYVVVIFASLLVPCKLRPTPTDVRLEALQKCLRFGRFQRLRRAAESIVRVRITVCIAACSDRELQACKL